MPDSSRGAVVNGPAPRVAPADLEAYGLALAAKSEQRRAALLTSRTSPRKVAPPGAEVVARFLDYGQVPERYRNGDWGRVRNQVLTEFRDTLAERADPRFGPNPVKGEGALVFGPVGTGKSTVAGLIAVAAAQRRIRTVWKYVPTLLDDLSTDRSRRRELVRRMSEVPLVVWDDFAARDMTQHDVGLLDQVVEARYAARLPMIVTTNLLPQDLASDERLGRLLDRWRDLTCRFAVGLVGESARRR